MTRIDTNNIADAIDKGIAHSLNGDLFTASVCFVGAHHNGDERAVRYLRALRPFCDDLTFGMVAIDIISR